MSESLISLVRSLDRVYHECSIRADDLDFQSTMKSLKQMTDAKGKGSLAGASGMSEIMLRSELENIKAVLDDAAGWNPPDFLALAYYFAHEERDTVRDMESGQRNTYVLNYFNEHFMNQFLAAADHAGQKEQVLTLIQEYVYGE